MGKSGMGTWRSRPLVAFAIVVGVAVVASGGVDVTSAVSSSLEHPARIAAPTSSGPEGDFDPEAEITLFNSAIATTWDPHTYSSISHANTYMAAVYDRLFYFDPAFNLLPGLASDWEFSEDSLTLTATLRDDVTFHDGSPFNAEVVKANLERVRGLEGTSGEVQARVIEAIDVLGEYEVEITLNAPTPLFPTMLAYYPNLGSMISPLGLADPEALLTTSAGSGLYMLESQSEDTSELVKFDDYWDQNLVARAPRRLTIITPAPEAAFNLLASGQIQGLGTAFQLLPEYQELIDQGGYKLAAHAGRNIQMFMNLNNPALADVRVRRAINLAMNREDINQAVYGGTCPPTSTGFKSGEPGYTDALAAYDNLRDVDEARRLLAEAGYEPGELTFTNVFSNGIHLTAASTLLQAQLAEVGINFELVGVPGAEATPTWRLGGHDIQVTVAPSIGPEHQFWMEEFFLASNMPGGIPDELRAMIEEQLQRRAGSEERVAGWEEIALYLAENPVAPGICGVSTLHLLDERVVGVEETPLIGTWNLREIAYLAE